MGIIAAPKLQMRTFGRSHFDREYPPALRATPMTPEAYAERIKVLEARVAGVVPPSSQFYGPIFIAFIIFGVTIGVSASNRLGFVPPLVAFVSIVVVGVIASVYYHMINKQIMKSFMEIIPELNLLDEPYGFTWDVLKKTTTTTTTYSNGSSSSSRKYSYRVQLFYSKV
ncbi:hypothetical protein BJ742DRAFT_808180 [Cladochytrium replicatum]|nr:hypothetical protein BJ742DRAFT_808180 [Cladochytrium replicatum]